MAFKTRKQLGPNHIFWLNCVKDKDYKQMLDEGYSHNEHLDFNEINVENICLIPL